MQRKRFRYFLKTSAGEYYVRNGSQVFTTATPTPFAADPVDWKDQELQYERNNFYHGIFFNYSASATMVKDAATILRHIRHTQYGFESDCLFYVEKLTASDQIYRFYYQCDINFASITDDDIYVQVELLERGLFQMIKDRENTPYSLPVTASDRVPIVIEGPGLRADHVNGTLARYAGGFNSTQLYALETIAIDQDGAYSVGEQRAQIYQPMGTPLGPSWATNSSEHANYIYRVDKNLTAGVDAAVKLDIEIGYNNPSGTGINYHLELRAYVASSASGAIIQMIPLYSDAATPVAPGSPAVRRVIKVTSPQFHMAPDDRLYVVFYILGPGASGGANASDVLFFGQQRVNVLVDFQIPSTLHYGYWYRQLFTKLIAKMTDGLYGSQSDFLNNASLSTYDNKPYQVICLPGDAVRRLYTNSQGLPADPMIKTTLRELYEDASGRWMVGMGVERDINGNQIIRMEHLSHFYDNNSVSVRLGVIAKFQTSYATDYIYNQVQAGNGNFSYDALNGKDEPGTTQTYKLPVSRISNELNLVTKYRSDIYGIESLRANLSEKKTTDSDSDNDLFLIEATQTPGTFTTGAATSFAYYPLRLQNVTGNSATGMINPAKAYNLSMSPKRNFFRNGARLRIAAYQQDGKTITFQKSEKNADLVSNLGSGQITESADVQVASLPAPLFMPLLFQFETAVPQDLPLILAENPYGRIEFDWRHPKSGLIITLAGFIDSVSIRPGDKGVCTWKLLACPDTDLSQLIW